MTIHTMLTATFVAVLIISLLGYFTYLFWDEKAKTEKSPKENKETQKIFFSIIKKTLKSLNHFFFKIGKAVIHICRTAKTFFVNKYKKYKKTQTEQRYQDIARKMSKQETVSEAEEAKTTSKTTTTAQTNSASYRSGATDPNSDDFRQHNPKPYRCEDGDYVRSKAEREIDDFLYQHRIWHIYEPEYISPWNKQKYYPDFFLKDYNVYIEYFGLSTKDYEEKRKRKIETFQHDPNAHFEYLDQHNDANIKEKLIEICIKYNIPIKEKPNAKKEEGFNHRCKICGLPSGKNEVCQSCQKKINAGEIGKCSFCGNFFSTQNGCSCKKTNQGTPQSNYIQQNSNRTNNEKDKSSFSKGFGTVFGGGCGCTVFIIVAIAILIFIITKSLF